MAEYLLSHKGPVTLITSFRVREGASEERFIDVWSQVGRLMAGRSGFVSSRLYRPMVGGSPGQYIHVAEWTHAALLADARADPEVRSVERELEGLLTERRRMLCDPATGPVLPARH